MFLWPAMHLMKYFQNYYFFLKNMIFCNFRKFLMISVDLGLQCVPQVFNIFEKCILCAQRTFGRSTKNHFFGLTTTIRVKKMSEGV